MQRARLSASQEATEARARHAAIASEFEVDANAPSLPGDGLNDSAGGRAAAAEKSANQSAMNSGDDQFVKDARAILQRLPQRDLQLGREQAVEEATVQLGKLFPEVDTLANITELNGLLRRRVEGAENVGEIVYWLLGFRERVRAQSGGQSPDAK